MAEAAIKAAKEDKSGQLANGYAPHIRNIVAVTNKRPSNSPSSGPGDSKMLSEVATARQLLEQWLHNFRMRYNAEPAAQATIQEALQHISMCQAWEQANGAAIQINAAKNDRTILKSGVDTHIQKMNTLASKKPQLTQNSVAADDRMVSEAREALKLAHDWTGPFHRQFSAWPDAAPVLTAMNAAIASIDEWLKTHADHVQLNHNVVNLRGPLKSGLASHLSNMDRLLKQKPSNSSYSAPQDKRWLEDCEKSVKELKQWLDEFKGMCEHLPGYKEKRDELKKKYVEPMEKHIESNKTIVNAHSKAHTAERTVDSANRTQYQASNAVHRAEYSASNAKYTAQRVKGLGGLFKK